MSLSKSLLAFYQSRFEHFHASDATHFMELPEIQEGLDKYGSKHKDKRTNVQVKIGGPYGQMRTDGVYRREGTNGVYCKDDRDSALSS